MKREEKIILEKDVVLPEKETIEVYNIGTKESPNYVLSEISARNQLITHYCCLECGSIVKKGYSCNKCAEKRMDDKYSKAPFKEWDGETPLCIFNDDTYFFSEDEIEDYLEENEIEADELQLMICSPNHVHEIDADYWYDDMPECYDSLEQFSKEFVEKLVEFNKYISTLPPLSWSQGIYKTAYKQ